MVEVEWGGCQIKQDNEIAKLKDLNFKVPRIFHKEFSILAAETEVTNVELLRRAFCVYVNSIGRNDICQRIKLNYQS